MKSCVFLLAGALLVAGCKTNTIETRKAERPAAYAALSPEMKQLVDSGQIRVGMSMDEVYISWGAPSQELRNESEQGASAIWLYHGAWMQETRFWSFREVHHGKTVHLERFLDREYDPRDYVRAELVFVGGKLKSWRTLPRPVY